MRLLNFVKYFIFLVSLYKNCLTLNLVKELTVITMLLIIFQTFIVPFSLDPLSLINVLFSFRFFPSIHRIGYSYHFNQQCNSFNKYNFRYFHTKLLLNQYIRNETNFRTYHTQSFYLRFYNLHHIYNICLKKSLIIRYKYTFNLNREWWQCLR